jgi:hypothetical protein
MSDRRPARLRYGASLVHARKRCAQVWAYQEVHLREVSFQKIHTVVLPLTWSSCGDVGGSGSRSDELHNVSVLAQPAMSCNLEQVRTFSRVWDQNALQQIPGMRRNIFGECQWGRYNVLIQEVDIIALGVRWIVVEW